MIAALPFFQLDSFLEQFNRIMSFDSSAPNAWIILMIIQGFSSAGGFILAAWAYLFLIEKRSLGSLNTRPGVALFPLLIILGLAVTFIFFNEWIAQWNRNWDLPDWMSGFERWSRAKQEEIGKMTQFLTAFDSFGRFLIAMLVIAVLPAIGEELMFRGALQSILIRWFKNAHLAIWATGAFFSFIHFQLDGFIPRMLLGVVFGYLYVWSGNLWYAIWAHFINNGIQVLAFYLNKAKVTKIDMENTQWVTWQQGLMAALISGVLLWYLKRLFDQSRTPFTQIEELR